MVVSMAFLQDRPCDMKAHWISQPGPLPLVIEPIWEQPRCSYCHPYVLEHLGPPIESWWRDLGNVALNKELNEAIAWGVAEELGGAGLAGLARRRDDALLALLQLKAGMAGPS
jgi:hypothetical protein